MFRRRSKERRFLPVAEAKGCRGEKFGVLETHNAQLIIDN
jgi:hypothetical protein